MLSIRFARVGKKNKAYFKIMLQEHTAAPGGRHVEILGSYDPHKKEALLKEERIKYWISKGAKASDTVHNLLVSKGIVSDKKRAVKIPEKTGEAKPKEETKAEEKKPEGKKEVKTEEIREEKAIEETKKGESKSEAKE
ncbi:MAG TPA: 30S ribosomal protein S16 [Candidatus Moranbacteria bacterium]|nr:30S ribosomal protein S16 [Candidatus Moranbacteria bacterium]